MISNEYFSAKPKTLASLQPHRLMTTIKQLDFCMNKPTGIESLMKPSNSGYALQVKSKLNKLSTTPGIRIH